MIRLYVALGILAAVGLGDVWIAWHWYDKGVAHEKAKVEAQIRKADAKGNAAKAEALRELQAIPDDSPIPDDGFQRND